MNYSAYYKFDPFFDAWTREWQSKQILAFQLKMAQESRTNKSYIDNG